MRFFLILLTILLPTFLSATNYEFIITVAGSAFEEGNYNYAKRKCNEVLSNMPENKECLKIISDIKKRDLKIKQKEADKLEKEKQKKELMVNRNKTKSKKDKVDIVYATICDCLQMEKYFLNLIDEEKAKGRIGGFVNKKNIYNYSDKALIAQKVKKTQISKLMLLGGNKLDLSRCKYSININIINDKMMNCVVSYRDMLVEQGGYPP